MNKIIAFIVALVLTGCSFTTSTETIADGAKETISHIYEALPKECQDKKTKVAFESAMKEVDNVKAQCVAEKQILQEKIKQRNLVIGGLFLLLVFLIYHKVRSSLLKII